MTTHNDYTFKPYEIPPVGGAPAALSHHKSRRIAYFSIGIFLGLTAGIQNGLLTASVSLLTGDLGLNLEQAGWVQVAYFMTYACMGITFFRIRQHFGLYRFIRWMLGFMLLSNLLQTVQNSYYVEVAARAVLGIGTNGLFITGMFYLMQAFNGPQKIIAIVINIGSMQLGMPLSQLLVPPLFGDGNMQAIFLFQFAMVLIAAGLIICLPLPPSFISKSITRGDIFTLFLLMGGVSSLCAFLVQGRILWWTTEWLGYLLASGIILIGCAFLFEKNRARPFLDWQLIFSPQMLIFTLTAGLTRLLTSEQSVGVSGLLSALGVGYTQMTGYYGVIFSAALLGAVLSVLTFDMQDLRRPVMISMFGIALGSWLDIGAGIDSRPAQFYFSQALVAFSSFYFIGGIMVEGVVRTFARSTSRLPSFILLIALSQTFGTLIGMAGFSAFVTVRTRVHYANIAAQIIPTDPLVTQFVRQQSAAALNERLNTEATVLAYNDLFAFIAFIAAIAFVYLFGQWLFYRLRGVNPLTRELTAMGQNMRPKL